MPDKNLDSVALGHVYAEALTRIAQKQNALPDVSADIQGLSTLLDTMPRFDAFIQAVTISPEEKMAALEKMFKDRLNPLTLRTLVSMAKRDRLIFMRGFIAAFNKILEGLSNQVDVEVTTAIALSDSAARRIEERVGASLKKTVVLHQKTNPLLLGGMVLQIGDTLIDGSVEAQLARVKTQMQNKGGDFLRERTGTLVTTA